MADDFLFESVLVGEAGYLVSLPCLALGLGDGGCKLELALYFCL